MNCGFIKRTVPGRFALLLMAAMGGTGMVYGWNTLTPLTNVVACPGDNAAFSTVASGAKPWKFSWYKNGALLAGKTNSSLIFTNVGATNVGTYTVILQGGFNNVTNSATLSLKTPVSITPLTSVMRSIGGNVIFSTVASGTGPFTYSWQRNGSTLPGRTNSSLNLTNLQIGDSGTYTVIVNGSCGSSATSSATLTVDTCFPAVDVVLVLDRSGSMTGKPYDDARQAASNFVHNLHMIANADQAALVSYNSSATLDQTLTNSVPAMEQALHLLPGAGGYTSISLGLQTGQTELSSTRHNPQALPVLVLLSDGLPTGSDTKSNALLAATLAKNAGTRVFTVGLGGVDPVLMAGIASSTNDYFYTTNSSQLTALFNAISTVICRPPTNIFVTGLSNAIVCPGSTASFSASASGCAPFTYQWKKDGLNLSGQTNGTLVIPNAVATNAGVYSIVVTGACGSATNSVTLTVNAPVLVVNPPLNLTNCPGSTAVFSVEATGTGLTYQWYQGATALNGETGSSLTLTNIGVADVGLYSVTIAGVCGLPLTYTASLALNEPLNVITPPAHQTVCPGSTAFFSVNATGTGLNYQWFKNGNPLADQTAAFLTITNATALDQGIYSVIVNGACGSATNDATLTVNAPVSATPLLSQTNCSGTTAVFGTIASGAGPFGYLWLKNGVFLGGQTNANLILNNVSLTNAGVYSVIVRGACDSVTNSAILVINTTLSAIGPTAQTGCAGESVTFSTVASGTGPYSYQWYHSTNALPGQTGASLTIDNLSATDAGSYRVIIEGACGTLTNSASLSVRTPVSAVGPTNQLDICPDGMAALTTIASGTGPISFLWFKDGNLLADQTNSSLILTGVNASSSGLYSVLVSGPCNSVTNGAMVTVATVVDAIGPVDQSVCPGDSAVFTTIASGTGPYTYQWRVNGDPLLGQTNSSLTLFQVGANDAAVYSVVVGGACGSVIRSATLSINQATSILPMARLVRNFGGSGILNAIVSGTGPFAFVWKKNGIVIPNQTGSSLNLSNIIFGDEATYTVEVTGTCNTAVATASVHVNLPPTVSIINPTNGTIFIAPASFAIAADAQDLDGTVTNVEFFVSDTNKLGESALGNPFTTVLTNVPVGTNVFTAMATDNDGASGISTPVSIIVLPRPPLIVNKAVHFNPQTGLYEQTVQVLNPTYSMFDAVRVYIYTGTNAVHVYNPSGVTNGVPYVQSSSSVPPGSSVTFVIEYYVTAGGVVPNPTLVAELVPPGSSSGGAVSAIGTGLHVNRAFIRPDGNFLVEFATVTNRLYYVQYSSDLKVWKTATPAIAGNGTWIQWIDNGQPKTESAPPDTSARFYRVIVLP